MLRSRMASISARMVRSRSRFRTPRSRSFSGVGSLAVVPLVPRSRRDHQTTTAMTIAGRTYRSVTLRQAAIANPPAISVIRAPVATGPRLLPTWDPIP